MKLGNSVHSEIIQVITIGSTNSVWDTVWRSLKIETDYVMRNKQWAIFKGQEEIMIDEIR